MVNGRSVLSKSIISKENLALTKVKTLSTHTRDTDPAIKLFVKRIMRRTADMRKVGNSGDGDHLGQIE